MDYPLQASSVWQAGQAYNRIIQEQARRYYLVIMLASARLRHQDYKRLLAQGIDPRENERIEAERARQAHLEELHADTVGELVKEFMQREVSPHLKGSDQRKRYLIVML